MFSLTRDRSPPISSSRHRAACCDGAGGDEGCIATTSERRVVLPGLDSAYDIPSRANANAPRRPTGRAAKDGELPCFTDQPLLPCPLPRPVPGLRLAHLGPLTIKFFARHGESQQEVEQTAIAKSRACNDKLSLLASEWEARLLLLALLPSRRDGTFT